MSDAALKVANYDAPQTDLTNDADHQIISKPETQVNLFNPLHAELLDRTVAFIAPWTPTHKYPGRQRTVLGALGRGSVAMVSNWRRGRRRFPGWAALAFETYIRAWIARATALADELRDYAAITPDRDPVAHLRGCMKVGEDGRDRRGNWRAR